MIRFVCARIARLLGVLLFASLLVYSALYLAPGSPLAVLSGGRSLTPAQVAQLSAQYHLNDSFLVGYWAWLSGILHGNFGESVISKESVSTLIAARADTTLLLVAYASVLIIVVGLGLGLTAALRGGATDTAIVSFTGGLSAVPSFVAADVLVIVFAVNLTWFPVFGSGSGLLDKVWHLTLPAIALALAATGYCARVTRTATLDERGREHVEIARSRGIPGRRVIRRHVLANALVPITTAVGVTVASLIAGSVVVEQAFALNGLGSLLIQAVQAHDFAVVQAVTLILVAVFIIVNTIVDLTYTLLDPRIKLRAGA
jgi:peptide/nickel transport system permease protein